MQFTGQCRTLIFDWGFIILALLVLAKSTVTVYLLIYLCSKVGPYVKENYLEKSFWCISSFPCLVLSIINIIIISFNWNEFCLYSYLQFQLASFLKSKSSMFSQVHCLFFFKRVFCLLPLVLIQTGTGLWSLCFIVRRKRDRMDRNLHLKSTNECGFV